MSLRIKTILALCGIFLAGVAAGALLFFGLSRRVQHVRMQPDQWPPFLLQRLADDLELSESQREALRPILASGSEQIRQIRQRAIGQTLEVMQRMERDISTHLDAEQRAKYERIREERRERMRRVLERGEFPRRLREGGRPPPPSQPPSTEPSS